LVDLKDDLASLKIEREVPRSRSPWRWPLLLLVPALLFLGGLYTLRIREASSAPLVETDHATRSAVTADTATSGSPVLTASGYIVARRQAVVSAKIQGRLADLRFEEGDRVGKGELIARLESDDYEAQVRRAEAQVQRTEADLAEEQRKLRLAEELASESVLSANDLEAAQSRVRVTQAVLSQAQADLQLNQALFQNTLIRAPFTGTVLKKMAEVGESVAPIPPGVNISTASGAIVALADLDTLEVEADVSETNVAQLREAQPAEVSVEAFPDRRYKAVLRQIIPTADRTKATVMVKVTILDKDALLKPEMSARVTFLEPDVEVSDALPGIPAEVMTVSNDAVTSRDGSAVVFVVREGRVHQRAVVVGRKRSPRSVITSGLDGNERLVLSPPADMQDGDTVRVAEPKT
jgi:RND family efflux transporter MFP subunit